jgi:cysteine-rich repeat protein
MPGAARIDWARGRPCPASSRNGIWPVVALILLSTVARASEAAQFLRGRGDPRSECYVGLAVEGRGVTRVSKRDAAVVQTACGGTCIYKVQLCVNDDSSAACKPAPFEFVDVTGPLLLRRPQLDVPTRSCGSASQMMIRLRGKRSRREKLALGAHAREGIRPHRERDRFTLACEYSRGGCCGDNQLQPGEQCDDGNLADGDTCEADCTSAVCGNGVKDENEGCEDGNRVNGDGCDSNCKKEECGNGLKQAGEDCDPPSRESPSCSADEYCSTECKCISRPSCECSAPIPDFGRLEFTTGPGAVPSCGRVESSDGTSLELDCGALYVGGGDRARSAPRIPHGLVVTASTSCIGRALQLTPTPEGHRGCTTKGCFFGPPLPVVDASHESGVGSVCVINRISGALRGMIDCDSWRTDVTLPIETSIYLTNDLLEGARGPTIDDIQPCPLCIDRKCKGGANHGKRCAVDIADPDARQTSQDCPPPIENLLGTTDGGRISITLGLTTETTTAPARRLDDQNVFYGFCRQDKHEGTCFQGNGRCLAPAGLAVACTSNATCTDSTFPSCQQHGGGAFGQALATSITMVGARGGNPAVGPTEVTLAGVFGVPPLFEADDTVSNSASVPGPAAIALPGMMQLFPAGAAVRESEP